eukprot:437726_1
MNMKRTKSVVQFTTRTFSKNYQYNYELKDIQTNVVTGRAKKLQGKSLQIGKIQPQKKYLIRINIHNGVATSNWCQWMSVNDVSVTTIIGPDD